VLTVSGATGKFVVTVQRLDESQPDPNTYLCSVPVYIPMAGDTVDILWFDDALGYVMWPLAGPGLTSAASPSGAVTAYAGAVAPPGWLLCDGSAVSRTTYGTLFTAIGVAYGAGDGSTTFNLPDLRGRAPIGAGTGSGLTARALAAKMGEEAHPLTTAELAAHAHSASQASHYHGSDNGKAFIEGAGSNWLLPGGGSGFTQTYNTNTVQPAVTVNSAGSGNGHNTMQPSIALNFIVKT
jgi:microcystin-dependent protein